MKKIKILSLLLALIMCMSVIFISCDKEETTYKIADIMNAEWKMDTEGKITSFKDASYKGDYLTSSYNFVVTKEEPKASEGASTETDANVVTRVYNVVKNQAVATLTESVTVDNSATPAVTTTEKHYVDIISDKYFAVLTVVDKGAASAVNVSEIFKCPLSSSYEYTLSIRDESGAVVETFYNTELVELCDENISAFDRIYSKNDSDSIIYEYESVSQHMDSSFDYESGFDLVVIGNKVYRIDSKLNTTLIKDYGLVSKPAFESMKKVGEYYLESDDGLYAVYDKDLNKLFDYTIPGYANGNVFLLANGNLFVQYTTQLDQNEKKFDVRQGADGKYDLYTAIVNKDGVTELEDVNYFVSYIKPSVAGLDGKKIYADTVENLAFIYYIGENKMLDVSYANQKLVLLANDGTVTAEVETDGYIADFPIQYRNTFYAVELYDGSYNIYDKLGEMKGNLSSSAILANVVDGSYLRIGDVIYKADGSVAYDMGKDHVGYKQCGDTLIISKYQTKGVAYGIFVDGEVKNIGVVSLDEKIATIKGFDYSDDGYYYTRNKDDNKYTYYNTDGTVIGTFDNLLKNCLVGEEFIIMYDSVNKIFYKFEITK